MEKRRIRLKGHDSFVPRDGWITKGLCAVNNDPKVFEGNYGADELGVGTNMAKAIRYWLKTAGLTKESSSKGALLTDFGRTVFENDLYIEDVFTLWMIHSNIVSNFENATSWFLFFNRMRFSSSFSREDAQLFLKRILAELTGDENLSERSIKDDCAAILSMYSRGGSPSDDPEDKRTSPFDELGLVSKQGNLYSKQKPSYDKLDKMVVLSLFVEELNSGGSLAIDSLVDGDNMPGRILNLNRIAVNNYLDRLHHDGYIVVNRTAGLDIVYPSSCRSMSRIDVIKEYYKRRNAV